MSAASCWSFPSATGVKDQQVSFWTSSNTMAYEITARFNLKGATFWVMIVTRGFRLDFEDGSFLKCVRAKVFTANCREEICEGWLAYREQLQMVEYWFYKVEDALCWHTMNKERLPDAYILMIPITYKVLYQSKAGRKRKLLGVASAAEGCQMTCGRTRHGILSWLKMSEWKARR